MATRSPVEQDENSTDMFVVVGTRTVPNVGAAISAGKIGLAEVENLSASVLPNTSMPESLVSVLAIPALPESSQDNLETSAQQNNVPMNLSATVLRGTSISIANQEKVIAVGLGDTVIPQNLSRLLPKSLVHAAYSSAVLLAENQEDNSMSNQNVAVHENMPSGAISNTIVTALEDNSSSNHHDSCMPENLSADGMQHTPVHENLSVSILPNTAVSSESPENLSVTVLPSTAMPEGESLSSVVLQNATFDSGSSSSKSLPAFSVMAGFSRSRDISNNGLAGGRQHVTVTQNLPRNTIPTAATHVSIGYGHVLVKGELPSPTSLTDQQTATIRLFVPENNGLAMPPGQLTLGQTFVKGEHPSPTDTACTCHVSVPISVHEMHVADNHSGNEINSNSGQISMGHILIKGEYVSAEEPQYVSSDDPQYSSAENHQYISTGDPHYNSTEDPQYTSTDDPQYSSAGDPQYPSTENQQYASTENRTYPSTEDHPYPSTENQHYPSGDDQQYSSSDNPHYSSTEGGQYPSTQESSYPSAQDAQYPAAEDPQYASADDVQYAATSEVPYSTSDHPVNAQIQVCAENLSSNCLSTPTLVQILRDPSTALRGPNPSAAALLISSISRMSVPENLSSSAEHGITSQLPADNYSRSFGTFAASLPARSEVLTRLPRLTLRTELLSSELLPKRKTASTHQLPSPAQQLPSPAQQLPSPVALCLSTKSTTADNQSLAVVKREAEYSDYTDYAYQSHQNSSRMSQFSPVRKQKATGEQTVRLPSIDTVVDRRARMETPSRDTIVVDRRTSVVQDTSTPKSETITPSSGLSEDVLSEFAIEFLAQRALQQSAQQAALQQAALQQAVRQAAQQAVRASTETQLQIPVTSSSSLVAMTLAAPLLAVPTEPAAKKRRRSQTVSLSEAEPLNLGSKKRQRTAMSMEVETTPPSPAPGPRKQRSFTHTGGRTCVCEVCNAVLSAPASLKTHMLIHSNIKPYPCSQCDASFRHQSTLKRHMCIHTGEKNFSCSVCQAQFARKTELTQHQRSHSTARPYSCKICASSYKHPKDLSQHLRNHARNAPHVCKECNASFNDISALKDHTRSHEVAGALPTCEVCGAKFEKVLCLTQHVVNSHMPSTPVKREKEESKASCSSSRITCSLCPLQFDDSVLMTQHMKESHWTEHVKSLGETKKGESGQQQHICKMCNKHFNTNNALSQHIKKKHWFADMESRNDVQGGETESDAGEECKYGCSLCGMEYPRLKSLAQHMKKSHSVNMLPCNKCGNTFVHMHNWLDHLKNCSA